MSDHTTTEYIDVTPMWTGVLPILLSGLRNPKADQAFLELELRRMASAADMCNKWLVRFREIADALSECRSDTKQASTRRADWIRLRDEFNADLTRQAVMLRQAEEDVNDAKLREAEERVYG